MEENIHKHDKGSTKCGSCNKPCSNCNDSSRDSRSVNSGCHKRPRRHESQSPGNGYQIKCHQKNVHHCYHKYDEVKPDKVCCRCSSTTPKSKPRCHDDKRSHNLKNGKKDLPVKKDSCQVEISQSSDVVIHPKTNSVGVQCCIENDYSPTLRKKESTQFETAPGGSQLIVDYVIPDEIKSDSQKSSRKVADRISSDDRRHESQKSNITIIDNIANVEVRTESQKNSKRIDHVSNTEKRPESRRSSKRVGDEDKRSESHKSSKRADDGLSNGKIKADSARTSKKPASEKSYDVEVILSAETVVKPPMSSSDAMYDNRISGISNKSSSKDECANSLKDHLAECERTKSLLAEKLDSKTQMIQDLQRQIEIMDKNNEARASKAKQSKAEFDGTIPNIDSRNSKTKNCDGSIRDDLNVSKPKTEKYECEGNIAIHLELRTVSGKETFSFGTKHDISSSKQAPDNVQSVTVDNE